MTTKSKPTDEKVEQAGASPASASDLAERIAAAEASTSDDQAAIEAAVKPARSGPMAGRVYETFDLYEETKLEHYKDAETGQHMTYRAWVNFPGVVRAKIQDTSDTAEMLRVMALVIVSHNGWLDWEGNALPQPSAGNLFWDSIDRETGAFVLRLVLDRNSTLPNLTRLLLEKPSQNGTQQATESGPTDD